ncbi:MAG: hypothetical protein JW821_02615 [Deltaproteobacteria bacterium]|nr:hypothetical protein [Deltaproteobacteria bacterium]
MNRKRKRAPLRISFAFLYAFFFLILFSPDIGLADTVVIPLTYRRAEEAVPLVKTLLSREGRAAADPRTNSLVVVDTPESIRNVHSFLRSFDVPVKQVRVRVRFDEASSSHRQGVSGSGRASGRDWEVGVGKKRRSGDGVEIEVEEGARTRERKSEYFISVMSGSWAYILVGKEIPYTQRWVDLCRRYARVFEGTVIQRIETGMEVRPTLMGSHADVEILPRIARLATGRKDVVRFSSASTRLSAPLNRWVSVGGADRSSNEVIRAILEAGRRQGASSLSISLMVQGP